MTEEKEDFRIRFKIYLLKNKITSEDFAAKVKITSNFLRVILSGRKPCSIHVGEAIANCTQNEFKAEEIMSLFKGPRKKIKR